MNRPAKIAATTSADNGLDKSISKSFPNVGSAPANSAPKTTSRTAVTRGDGEREQPEGGCVRVWSSRSCRCGTGAERFDQREERCDGRGQGGEPHAREVMGAQEQQQRCTDRDEKADAADPIRVENSRTASSPAIPAVRDQYWR